MILRALEVGVQKPLQLRTEQIGAPRAEPLRLLYLSDLHLHPRRETLLTQQILAAVHESAPDLLVLGGDLIDSPRSLPALRTLLQALRTRTPCAAVPGNHDRYFGLPQLNRLLRECGIHLLAAQPLEITLRGRDFRLLSQLPQASALEQRSSCCNILCLHDPAELKQHTLSHVTLALAGHLHGSQMVLWQSGSKLYPGAFFYRWNGLRFSIGDCTLVVSRGAADTLPLRWNCARELVLCLL
jgi:predicted MPP superfamily phosphohydrolase